MALDVGITLWSFHTLLLKMAHRKVAFPNLKIMIFHGEASLPEAISTENMTPNWHPCFRSALTATKPPTLWSGQWDNIQPWIRVGRRSQTWKKDPQQGRLCEHSNCPFYRWITDDSFFDDLWMIYRWSMNLIYWWFPIPRITPLQWPATSGPTFQWFDTLTLCPKNLGCPAIKQTTARNWNLRSMESGLV